ncbi:unnamed protein product [Mesocestoides corti]|uniref:Uncharacterized protein n=2 Tax=Mesocestoides corti TaxID=53468 RepID=A0A158QUV0_MESCO|nr:unnamed protein product [Mesocestoides corti]
MLKSTLDRQRCQAVDASIIFPMLKWDTRATRPHDRESAPSKQYELPHPLPPSDSPALLSAGATRTYSNRRARGSCLRSGTSGGSDTTAETAFTVPLQSAGTRVKCVLCMAKTRPTTDPPAAVCEVFKDGQFRDPACDVKKHTQAVIHFPLAQLNSTFIIITGLLWDVGVPSTLQYALGIDHVETYKCKRL